VIEPQCRSRGSKVILVNDFGAGKRFQGRGNAKMITTAVVSRAARDWSFRHDRPPAAGILGGPRATVSVRQESFPAPR